MTEDMNKLREMAEKAGMETQSYSEGMWAARSAEQPVAACTDLAAFAALVREDERVQITIDLDVIMRQFESSGCRQHAAGVYAAEVAISERSNGANKDQPQ